MGELGRSAAVAPAAVGIEASDCKVCFPSVAARPQAARQCIVAAVLGNDLQFGSFDLGAGSVFLSGRSSAEKVKSLHSLPFVVAPRVRCSI